MAKQTPNKPTPEELKAKEDEAIKAAEELDGRQNIPPDEEEAPEEKEPLDPEPLVSKETPEEEEAEPSEEVKERLKVEVEEKRQKLAAFARENQKIYAKNRVINKALLDADEILEPTEEELVKEFPQWEDMTETERVLGKETVISRNWRKKISEAKDHASKIEKWNESVETFIDDPKTLIDNPDLEGKTEEFKEFATQESNNSVPLNVLVPAFLHNHSSNKQSSKGRMFEKGSGGPNDRPKPKDGKVSLEVSRKIRETDYPRWKELSDKNLIDYDI